MRISWLAVLLGVGPVTTALSAAATAPTASTYAEPPSSRGRGRQGVADQVEVLDAMHVRGSPDRPHADQGAVDGDGVADTAPPGAGSDGLRRTTAPAVLEPEQQQVVELDTDVPVQAVPVPAVAQPPSAVHRDQSRHDARSQGSQSRPPDVPTSFWDR